VIVYWIMKNISRMEQDTKLNLRKYNKLIDKDRSNQNSRDRPYGEITGKDMKIDAFDYGMPFRTNFIGKKIDDKAEININRSDFDLFDDNNNNNNNYNITSYEKDTNNFILDDDNPEKLIPELYGTDSGSQLSTNINNFAFTINNLLANKIPATSGFCISGYSLYALFSGLYIASSGKTETEIYEYFGMLPKENTHEGLININNLLNKMRDIAIKNVIIIDDMHILDDDMSDYINKIAEIKTINKQNPDNEYNKINTYLNKISKDIAKVSLQVIQNANIVCLTVGIIKPQWKYAFTDMVKSKFYLLNGKSRDIYMMGINNMQYDYYENNLFQMIEIGCNQNNLVMGIVISKNLQQPNINVKTICKYIKELKKTLINELYIPVFTQQMKIRLSSIIAQSGLKTVFTSLNIDKLIDNTNNNISVSDIIQNITVIVDNNNNNNKKYMNKISQINFIGNQPFLYYFRLVPTNTLLLCGYYT
jgi:hypothetical protein